MCPGGIPRGGADAQWKQIGSIARADMPWSAVEWRLARQMNCTNAQHRPQKATGGHGRQDAMFPANHRARQYALEVSPEGVPTLNGNKLGPSRDLHFLKPLTHKKLLFLEPRDD